MKLQKLSAALRQTASSIARDLAVSEACAITTNEYLQLTLTPTEREAVKLLYARIRSDSLHNSVVVTLPGPRPIEFAPVAGLKELFTLKDCAVSAHAPDELVERLAQWYDRRLMLGHLGAAFEHYCHVLIDCCPTAAHLYRCFNNITVVFARCSQMVQADVNEAMRISPRDAALVPRKYAAIREPATQAAVLLELLGDEKNRSALAGNYVLNLPRERKHLEKVYAQMPMSPDMVVQLQPL